MSISSDRALPRERRTLLTGDVAARYKYACAGVARRAEPFYKERAPTTEDRKRGTEFPYCTGLEILVAEKVIDRSGEGARAPTSKPEGVDVEVAVDDVREDDRAMLAREMPKALGFHRRPDVVDARSRALRLQEGEFIELQCRADVVVGPLDASPAASTGALFITTLRVAFVPDTAHGDGDGDGDAFEMNYQSIALHAVSRADAAHAQRGCVYCHIDGGAEDAPARDDDDDDDDDDEASVEVRFVPHEPTTVDSVFAALSACAELNPDTEDEDEDGDEEDGYYYDESSVLADDIDGSKRAALESYDGKLVMPNADELDALLNQPGRFADAEDA